MSKEQRFFGTSRGLGPHASRRGLLQAGLAIGTLALGQRAAQGQPGDAHTHMPELGVAKLPFVPAMDQSLVEPEVRRSANGVLSTSLRCAYTYRDLGGTRLYLRAYEGGLGPTLRMKPGETLKIQLINDLPPNRDILRSNPSHPHQFNNTNFHFHGAHCSPSGIADNVMRLMEPGRATTSRSRCPRTTRAAPTGTIRISTARPIAGGKRNGRRHHRRLLRRAAISDAGTVCGRRRRPRAKLGRGRAGDAVASSDDLHATSGERSAYDMPEETHARPERSHAVCCSLREHSRWARHCRCRTARALAVAAVERNTARLWSSKCPMAT